jgi:RNA polymerase sigma-70 factor, ECF subfamily
MRTAWQGQDDETYARQLVTVFKENRQRILRAAYRVTGNWEDAKDAAQDVFVRLATPPPPTEFVRNPEGYLSTAGHNKALNIVRARESRNLVDEDIYDMEIPAGGPDLSREDEIAQMRDALSKMKPRYVEVLNLYYKEDLDCEQIAAVQRRLMMTVYKDLSRARAQVRKLVRNQEKRHEKEEAKRQGRPQRVLGDAH